MKKIIIIILSLALTVSAAVAVAVCISTSSSKENNNTAKESGISESNEKESESNTDSESAHEAFLKKLTSNRWKYCSVTDAGGTSYSFNTDDTVDYIYYDEVENTAKTEKLSYSFIDENTIEIQSGSEYRSNPILHNTDNDIIIWSESVSTTGGEPYNYISVFCNESYRDSEKVNTEPLEKYTWYSPALSKLGLNNIVFDGTGLHLSSDSGEAINCQTLNVYNGLLMAFDEQYRYRFFFLSTGQENSLKAYLAMPDGEMIIENWTGK